MIEPYKCSFLSAAKRYAFVVGASFTSPVKTDRKNLPVAPFEGSAVKKTDLFSRCFLSKFN